MALDWPGNEDGAPPLIQTARAYAMRGEWMTALEILSTAGEQNIEPAVIESERRRFERQQRIWDDIWDKQKQAELMKAQNRRVEARWAYSDAALLASCIDSGLDAELRALLVELHNFFNTLPATYGQGGDHLLGEARVRLDQVICSGAASPLGDRFSTLVCDWFDISVLCGYLSMITGLTILGYSVDAYAVARKQLRQAFGDSEIAERVSVLQATILGEVTSSLGKRIDRAENNAKSGNFEKALADLASIDESLNPVKSFPEIIEADSIQKLLQCAADTERKLQKLQQRATTLAPMVEAINKAYVAGKLNEAERLIVEAEVIDAERSAFQQWEQIDSTHTLIRKRRQEMTARAPSTTL